MSQYKCRNCGATAYSKCAVSRSVFPDNQSEALMSVVVKYEFVGSDLKLTWRNADVQGATEQEILYNVLRNMKAFSDDTLRQYACGSHQWELQNDTCELGCCTRKQVTVDNTEPEDDGSADEAAQYAEWDRFYTMDRI